MGRRKSASARKNSQKEIEPSVLTLSPDCILCEHPSSHHFHSDNRRDYYQCAQCQLVFVPYHQHLSPEDEKAEYDKHQNVLHDHGYLTFLSRVAKPVLTKLDLANLADNFGENIAVPLAQSSVETKSVPQPQKSDTRLIPPLDTSTKALKGLEFGCGPGPALAAELQRLGLDVDLYDVFYHNDPEILDKQYDFVTCTEVVEHFNRPKRDLPILLDRVKPDGVLGIMTKLVIDKEKFKSWHYKNDLTHVAFFSQTTFEFVAEKFGFEVEFVGNDVILLTKS